MAANCEAGGLLSGAVWFSLLGAVEARHDDGTRVPLGRRRERALLGLLLLEVGSVVPKNRLLSMLWEDDPPATAENQLRTNVSRLRHRLDPDGTGAAGVRLLGRGSGYLVEVEADRIDAHRFKVMVEQARLQSDAGQRFAIADEALSLWRGPLLADAGGDYLRHRVGLQTEELWLAAVEVWAEAGLALGRHGPVIVRLVDLVERYPLRERLISLLMLALYADGRQAEALDLYERHRQRLAHELGVDPAAEVKNAQRLILRDGTDQLPNGQPPAGPVPAQLPPDLPGFTGRDDQLRRLDEMLRASANREATTIIAILGAPGMGKTALAVHWARRIAARFPDGQLYVSLRGFHPAESTTEPGEALRGLLEALGVPPDRLPATLQAQAGLYRSMLNGRRMLVLLDDARDVEQVYPLLPGGPDNVVITTSRDRLHGLVVDGAYPLLLDVLPLVEARDLLTARLGGKRIEAEREATDEIVARCGGLPLALAVVAARAAVHPSFPLAALAAELREARSELDPFDAGDPNTRLRAVFWWSYRTLTAPAARLFRLLALHPGPDLAAPAAASLAGAAVHQVGPLLAELTRSNLLNEPMAGRYGLHDLLAAYAQELIDALDPASGRQAARVRLLDHYLHTGYAGDRQLYPHRDPIPLPRPAPGVTIVELADQHQALDWFVAEQSVLMAGLRQASETGFDTHTWQLAWTMVTFLNRQARWYEMITLQDLAIAATQRLDDVHGQAIWHRYAGGVLAQLGRTAEAFDQLRLALDLCGRLGDEDGAAHSHHSMAWLLREDDPAGAVTHAEQALDIYRRGGHLAGQADALNMMARGRIELGEHGAAMPLGREALTLHQKVGDQQGEADAWENLGLAHYHAGQWQAAVDCHQAAVELRRRLGEQYYQAEALINIADARAGAGDHRLARQALRSALEILDEIDHPAAERIRGRLEEHRGDPGPGGTGVG
jgi:DNA-binding SARP family transcriptional activator